MILAIDIGNTNVVVGLYKSDDLVVDFRISTDRSKTEDEYGMLLLQLLKFHNIKPEEIRGSIISSVVPPVVPVFSKVVQKYFGCVPLLVGPGIKTGIEVKYENPKEIGADRIVNAVAAYEEYGGPVIIVDFGTATTFCAVNSSGDYMGGSIAPGIGISSEALFSRAAKLPRIEIAKPKNVIGKNTVVSMQSGIFFGFVGQVDEIVRRMKVEMESSPKVIATGGLAELISTESKQIQVVDKYLTLKGLRILYERNQGR